MNENQKIVQSEEQYKAPTEILNKRQNIIEELSDFQDPRLDIYARLRENQLYHYFEPKNGIFIAESPNVIERALNNGCKPLSFLMERKHITGDGAKILDRCPDVPVFTGDYEMLTRLTGFTLTRGMLAAMYRPVLPSMEEICKDAHRIAILEDVVNPTNVGAIFRSAAALSVDAVLLTKASSDPLCRRASRVSMGTVFQVPWTYLPGKWPEDGISMLKEMGFTLAALALSDQSVSMEDPRLPGIFKLAMVLGTEGEGLREATIKACDLTVKIPMSHGVDSLNVAAASAVAFWATRYQAK